MGKIFARFLHVPAGSKKAGKRSLPACTERGSSLFYVIAFTLVVGAAITSYIASNEDAAKIERAKSAGWNLVQVAKAARLYVRNNSLDPAKFSGDINGDGIDDTTYNRTALNGPSPVDIPIASLVTAGLLPENFPTVNALGQTIRVIAANYPLGATVTPDTVATAYIYLRDSPASTPRLVQYMAEEARQEGLSIQAPIFSGTTNISDDCDGDGTADVVLWDSGCIGPAQFSQLTGAPLFIPGSLVAPAWRSMSHDPRAVMRYPQPENPQGSTMMTNLEMGTPVTDASGNCAKEVQVFVPDNAGGFTASGTGLCDVQPDDSTQPTWQAADRRFDITNADYVEADRYVLANQGAAETQTVLAGGGVVNRTDGDTGTLKSLPTTAASEVLSVTGVSHSLTGIKVTGRMPNPSVTSGPYYPAAYYGNASGTMGTLYAAKNLVLGNGSTSSTIAVNGPVTASSILTPGTLSAPGAALGGTLEVENYYAPAGINITSRADTVQLNMPGKTISTQDFGVTGALDMASVTMRSNIKTGSLVTGAGSTATVSGDVNSDAAVLAGTVSVGRNVVMNQCSGTCPDISAPSRPAP